MLFLYFSFSITRALCEDSLSMNNDDEKFWYLQQFNVLAVLSKADKEELKTLVTMLSYSRGERVNLSELLQQHVYFLKKGRIKMYKVSENGELNALEILGPGELFGRFLPGTQEQRVEDNVEMRAVDDCLLCYTDEKTWNAYVASKPALAISVIQVAGDRIRKLESKISDLQFLDSSSRINRIIRDLAAAHGRKIGIGFETEIPLALTHKDIGILSGTSRQTVTTHLRDLEKKNIISYNRERILVKDLNQL